MKYLINFLFIITAIHISITQSESNPKKSVVFLEYSDYSTERVLVDTKQFQTDPDSIFKFVDELIKKKEKQK